MSSTRTASALSALAAAAALPALAVTTAAARAEPPLLNGSYTAESGEQTGTWQSQSACAAEGCTAKIASSSGWHGVATLTGGRWHMSVRNPQGISCTRMGKPDGRTLPVTVVYSIDATTLTGTVGYEDNGECETQPGWREESFSLTKVG